MNTTDTHDPLLVVALGGNALLRRGEPLEPDVQLRNVRKAAVHLARLAGRYRLVVTHGNGPQVGLLALQNDPRHKAAGFPLDVLDAQTEGMIGYLLEQEIANCLPAGRSVATLLSRVEVDAADPAFAAPSKPIGPVYSKDEGSRLAHERGWALMPDGEGVRRAVASPRPKRIVGLRAVRTLLGQGSVVICAGGGGIPVVADGEGRMHGVEAVIDKDLVSSLLARQIEADMLLIATDVSAVSLDWGLPTQRAIHLASPEALSALAFAPGSMGPKVEAACAFARATSRPAVIGNLSEVDRFGNHEAGTTVSVEAAGLS
jgi:carbamate kinase